MSPAHTPPNPEDVNESVVLEEAEKTIEQIRKTEVSFEGLKPNTEYEVQLHRHEYPFGTAANFTFTPIFSKDELTAAYPQYEAEILAGFEEIPQVDQAKYLEVAQKLFSGVVPDNQLKWSSINANGPVPNWTITDRIIEYVKKDELQYKNFRGHCLFWNRRHRIPSFLETSSTEEIKNAAFAHLEAVLTRYPDIPEWDILNEPLRPVSKQEGGEPKETVFSPEDPATMDFYINYIKRAHELSPETRLYINEYNILTGTVDEDGIPKIDKFIDFMTIIKSRLEEEGFPLDHLGIGLQGHFWSEAPSIVDLNDRLSKIAELDLPIKITEFDISPKSFKYDTQAHAKWVADAFTVFYGCPSVKGIYVWGFHNNWRGKEVDLVDDNFDLTPAGAAYVSKVYENWGTNMVVKSDANGNVNFRGFPGEYAIAEHIV